LQNKSSFQKLFNRSPDYEFLKIFGCACFPNLRPYNKHKFDFQSRDVVFHDLIFPFSSPSSVSKPELQSSSTVLPSSLTLPKHYVQLSYTESTPSSIVPPTSSSASSPSSVASSSSASPSVSSSPISLSPTPCPAPTRIHPMGTRAHNQVVLPQVFTDGRIKYPIFRALLAVQDSEFAEPTCYSNAVKIPKWRQAMQAEFNALL
jgi:hypothetical protein